jgi:hypothetical protein
VRLINIAPGSPNNNDTLVIGCGRVADGKEFAPFAVRRNAETGIYEALPGFDFEAWEREISTRRSGGVRRNLTIREAFEKLPDFKNWTFGKLKEEIITTLCCSDTKAKHGTRRGEAVVTRKARVSDWIEVRVNVQSTYTKEGTVLYV